jgi:hypothetical protein
MSSFRSAGFSMLLKRLTKAPFARQRRPHAWTAMADFVKLSIGCRSSRGVEQHRRGLARISVAEKRHLEAWRIEGADLQQIGLAFHSARLGREARRAQ